MAPSRGAKALRETVAWSLLVRTAGFLWLAGFREACMLHRSTRFFYRSKAVCLRTAQCLILNGFFIGSVLLLDHVRSPGLPHAGELRPSPGDIQQNNTIARQHKDPGLRYPQPANHHHRQEAHNQQSQAQLQPQPARGAPPDKLQLQPEEGVQPGPLQPQPDGGLPPDKLQRHPDGGPPPDKLQPQPEGGVPPDKLQPQPDGGPPPDKLLREEGTAVEQPQGHLPLEHTLTSSPAICGFSDCSFTPHCQDGPAPSRAYVAAPACPSAARVHPKPLPTSGATPPRLMLRAVVVTLYYALWLAPLYIVALVFNIMWHADIAKNAFRIMATEGSTTATGSTGLKGGAGGSRAMRLVRSGGGGFLHGLSEEVYRIVLFAILFAEVAAVSLVPYVGPLLSFLLLAWLNAFYCFDYKWAIAGWSLDQRLVYFEGHWAFFLGFGTPFTLATFFLDFMISAGVWAMLFPLFLLVANTSDPDQSTAAIVKESEPVADYVRSVGPPLFRMASKQTSALVNLVSSFFSPKAKEQ